MGQAQIGAMLDDGRLCLFNVRRTAVFIDIEGIRLVVDSNNLCTSRLVGDRSNLGGRTIGGVYDHLDAAQVGGDYFLQVVEVALASVRGLRNDAAQLGAGRAILGEVFHGGLNLIFYLVW